MSRNIIGAITFLKDVAAGVTPAHPGFGLCYYLSGFGVRTGPYLWETWEHFSGDNQFPIPSPDGGHPGAVITSYSIHYTKLYEKSSERNAAKR